MRFIYALAASAAITMATPASAATLFTDGFEADAPALTVTNLTNWTLTGGVSVDVVGSPNAFSIGVTPPASGNVIDLDGTPGPATITSIQNFLFNAGDLVTFSFDVGGAQRGSVADNFQAILFLDPSLVSGLTGTGLTSTGLGSNANSVFSSVSIPGSTAFTTSSISFIATGAGSLKMAFGTTSADNIGPLLDNVRLDVSAVPEPATWAMMLLGLGFVGGAMRARRRKQNVAVRYA
ncbi:hypothetical protein GCM10009115_33470 [Sphingopyxis soli]|jgi:hypothetical protein|uniref:Ice-binding protein C-terminal domain-containing protein n=1 Tax=Sphingopyxis soli TaxID=592051 RepID=A0ABN1MCL4_9SPHN|nr:PEPxxWA-CTERM sorting domain-containing protein [Sphingopyxis soli]